MKNQKDTNTNSKDDNLGKLKSTISTTVLISETDPNNPYGPNYHQLPYEYKLYYKYLRLKKFIHLSPDDQKAQINHNYKFYGQIFGAGLGMFALSHTLRLGVINRKLPKLMEYLDIGLSPFYYGLFVASGVSYAYGECSSRYIKDFVIPTMENYQDEALKNGFSDYDISRDTRQTSWWYFNQFYRQ